MLKIVIAGDEVYDEESETFSTVNDVVLELEHSLISLSKWESARSFLQEKKPLQKFSVTYKPWWSHQTRTLTFCTDVRRRTSTRFKSTLILLDLLQHSAPCQNVKVRARSLLQN